MSHLFVPFKVFQIFNKELRVLHASKGLITCHSIPVLRTKDYILLNDPNYPKKEVSTSTKFCEAQNIFALPH